MDFQKRAALYYSRKDIQKAILSFSKNREVIPSYGLNRFGKRPDILEYENDFKGMIEKGLTSLHCSEELWNNPLDIRTEMSPEEHNSLRKGWDLILDIDSDFIEFSKITAQLIIEALNFHNIQNIGLKFSGRAGFHIGIPFAAFPKQVQEIKTKDYFPEGPRLISGYLRELISTALRQRILETTSIKELAARLKKQIADFFVNRQFNPFSLVDIDTILISPRHLFRTPYSLNEKSELASVVIKPEQIKSFHPGWARPERVFPKPYLPEPEKDEAKELFLQALDWKKHKRMVKEVPQRPRSNYVIKDAAPEFYPPCIKKILLGIKGDGRKRALFILINFFKAVNTGHEELKEKVMDWNKRNYKPLREGYILAQLSWFSKHKTMLPPNCENPRYRDLVVCSPDNLCRRIKNPVNYTVAKTRIKERSEGKKTKK